MSRQSDRDEAERRARVAELLEGFDPDEPHPEGGLFGLPHGEHALVQILPVPFEATASYGHGTADGPAAVRAASEQIDLFDLQTMEAWREGLHLVAPDPRVRPWNEAARRHVDALRDGLVEGEEAVAAREAVDRIGAQLATLVTEFTADQFDRGRIPGVLGGDHSVPLGAMVEAAARHPGLGVLHVDAHADLRVAYEGFRHSHASILHNVLEQAPGIETVCQVGLRDLGRAEWDRLRSDPRLVPWTDVDLAEALHEGVGWRALCRRIVEPLPEQVWITFDIDGLDAALCPGTGTPVPGGLSWRQTLTLLEVLGRSGRRIIGFDLCEVGAGDWDAIVGMRLLYKLGTWAISTR